MLEIRTLGRLEVRDSADGSALDELLARPKRVAFLAYLASARPAGPRRRDELLDLFWPQLDLSRARAALNQSVYVLRSQLGRDVIATHGGEEIELVPTLARCDAPAFDEALERGDPREALALYRGEFLEAFHLSGSRRFEGWLDDQREHYRQSAVRAAAGLAREEEGAGATSEAVRWLRQGLAWAPFDETLLRRLVQVLLARGDRTSAGREIERFEARIERDLGLPLSPETLTLRESLSGPAAARGLREPGPALAPVPGDAPGPPNEGAGSGAPAAPHESSTGASPDPGPPARRPAAELPREPGPRLRRLTVGGVALAALAVVLLVFVRPTPTGQAISKPARVAVFPLENRTGDEGLDPLGRIAADRIGRGLLHTGLVEVVPGADDPSGESLPVAFARRLGAGLMLSGSYRKEGDRLVIEAHVTDVGQGAIVRALEPVAVPEATPLEGIERLRRRAEGGLAALVDPRLSGWGGDASPPPTFEAYLVFARGLELLERERYLDAADRFLEAARADSTFTSALVWAIEAYRLSHQGPGDSLALALEPRRDGLAAWDRAVLDYNLADIRGDRVAAYEAVGRVVRLAPTPAWRLVLADQAWRLYRLHETRRILAGIDPEGIVGVPKTLYWANLFGVLHDLGDYAGELAAVDRWRAASAEGSGYARRAELRALAALGRVERVLEWVEKEVSGSSWSAGLASFFRRLALELRAHGHPGASMAVLDQSLALYDAAPDSVQRDPESRRQLGRSLYSADRWEESYTVFRRLIEEGHEPHVHRGDLALAAARLGDDAEARDLERWYREWDEEDSEPDPWITQWRVRIAAALGDAPEAARLLRQARQEGWPRTMWDHLNEEFELVRGYPAFDCLLRATDGPDAAACRGILSGG